jgi:monoamine oxidase
MYRIEAGSAASNWTTHAAWRQTTNGTEEQAMSQLKSAPMPTSSDSTFKKPWPYYKRVRDLEDIYRGTTTPRIVGEPPRVAVVGAGIAGLVAANLLTRGGCTPAVFDASTITGGRIRTDHGSLAPGVATELGGEFIDTAHADMIALARIFGCTPIDTEAPGEAELDVVARVGGRSYSLLQASEAFSAFAGSIRRDAQRLSPHIGRRRHTEADREFDRLSIDEYLDRIQLDGWLRSRICSGYTTLNGLDSAEQSSINLLRQMCTDPNQGFSIFGRSDERWKVAEGLDSILGGLARGLAAPVNAEHRLVRIRRDGATVVLEFATPGRVITFRADAVVLALPFTMLRHVDAAGVFSKHKQRAIDGLAYGTNSKVMVGMRRRIWRDHGSTGDLCTDGLLQSGWDASRLRAGEHGVYTFFLGGRRGLDAGLSTEADLALQLSAQASDTWADFDRSRTGTVVRVHWPTEPWVQASYSTYRPGQHCEFGGDESSSEASIHFAGEHCATVWQGYMQGAAATGREGALAILRRSSLRAPVGP